MAINPNWPLIEEAWAPYWAGAANGSVPDNRWAELANPVIGTTSTTRGRQYELDQVRSGEYQLTLDNTDATFDPSNTGSQYAGKVLPFQAFRRRAQYPQSINLLNQTQATGGDAGGEPLGTLNLATTQVFTDTDSTSGSIVTSGTAFRGSRVLQFAVPNATVSGARICQTPEPAAKPSTTYTVQLRVRNITPATTLQVKAHIGAYTTPGGGATYTFGSTVTLTGSATAAWTQITATLTLPAGVLGMNVGVTVAAIAGAACSVQVDEWQLEKGGSASAWVQPGTWYPMYGGFIERWPQTWTDPRFATASPTCVDAFALLSQVTLKDPLLQEITSRSPRFLYALGDPQEATSFADSAGANPAAQLDVSKYGPGAVVGGTQITSTSPGGAYTGGAGTVVTVTNPDPGTLNITGATFIALGSAGITGPANTTAWTRMVAFRYTGPLPAFRACLWSTMDGQRVSGAPGGARIYVYLDTAGKPTLEMAGPTGTGTSLLFGGATNCVDGNWHLLIFGYNSATAQIVASQDGNLSAFVGGIAAGVAPSGCIADNLGAFIDVTVGDGNSWNYKGDLSYVAEFGKFFASGDLTTVYQAWKTAFAGDSTNARYQRILTWAGYGGSTAIDTGLTTAMGQAIGGGDALSALQDVVTTENGAHYVDRAGKVTFKARSARYNALAPAYVFGDGPGEYPYDPGISFDFDPTRIANIVTATQTNTGQAFTAKDQASVTAYFPRTMSRQINTQSALEVQDAANYLLSRYKQPALRISAITLNPGANPSLWPVCLSLELGMRVTVNRRTAAGTTITQPCFVEQIQTTIAADNATWTLQLSPVDTTPYGLLAAWHTTLATSPSSGVTTITVNSAAGQNNTDPLAAQLAPGEQIILGNGTANQETVTVASVGTTTAGWTTATITLTAATTKAHTSGDVVCDVLPAGYTDPTTWDTVSALDAHALAY